MIMRRIIPSAEEDIDARSYSCVALIVPDKVAGRNIKVSKLLIFRIRLLVGETPLELVSIRASSQVKTYTSATAS